MKKLMNTLMYPCKDIGIQLANNENLSVYERIKQKAHLLICKSCREFSKQLKSLDQGVSKIKLSKINIEELNKKIIDRFKNKN